MKSIFPNLAMFANFIVAIMAVSVNPAAAQTGFDSRFGAEDYRQDTTLLQSITLKVGGLAFFKDNEFDGNVVKGYSLPGFRLQPRIVYRPIREITLELGAHATVYEGSNKYPSYVFHDIARWKGDQYQRGAHALPFFRATAHLERPGKGLTTLVVGDIYGGATHRLPLPLYNPELLLTDDPEAGVQIIADRKRWHSDVWVNWQSYIFEESTHQEAFTVGWAQQATVFSRKGGASQATHSLRVPVNLLIQHRGGEQDATDMGVQTIANASAGLRWDWSVPRRRGITAAHAGASALFALQQSGSLWPFDFGAGLWADASVTLNRDLVLAAGIFHASDFCSLYGSPYFGTLSVKYPQARFERMTTGYLSAEYSKPFAHGAYIIGAKANVYLNACGALHYPSTAAATPQASDEPVAGKVDAARFRQPFSFGVYFRVNPEFVLKRFAHKGP